MGISVFTSKAIVLDIELSKVLYAPYRHPRVHMWSGQRYVGHVLIPDRPFDHNGPYVFVRFRHYPLNVSSDLPFVYLHDLRHHLSHVLRAFVEITRDDIYFVPQH